MLPNPLAERATAANEAALLVQSVPQLDDSGAHTADRYEWQTAQAFSDASQQVATARAEQEHLEASLRQWDIVADLKAAANALRTECGEKDEQLKRSQQEMKERRDSILQEISEEFNDTVRAIGIPSVVTASVDSKKYLPVINGKILSNDTQLAGGTTTATQVAYWCSLLAVAMRHSESAYPAFLLIEPFRVRAWLRRVACRVRCGV